MTVERARAWVAGLDVRWRRWALVAAGIGAFVASVAGDDAVPCSPTDPAACGPDVLFSAAVVLALAATALVWWWPVEAAACAVAFAVLDIRFDDVLAANVAWTVLALLHGWHVVVLRRETALRQRAIADAFTPVPPVVPSTPSRDPRPVPLGPRHLAVAVLLAASLGCAGAYVLAARADAAHEALSQQVSAVVVAEDEELTYRVRVDPPLAGVPREHVIETYDEYEVGEVVPVRIDPADPGWTHLVAEPPDQTWWVSLSIGALLAAVVLGRPLVTGRMRRAALAVSTHPSGVPVRWVEVEDELVLLLATDGDVVVAELMTTGGPRPAAPDAPRLVEQVRSGWLVGDVRDGGWCALVHTGGLELPAAPLVVLPDLPSIDDASLDPDLEEDITAWSEPVSVDVERAELPASLTPTPVERAVGVVAAVCAPALGLWMLGWEEASWWQGIGLSGLVVSGVHWGLTRVLSTARVDREGIDLTDALERHRIPMSSIVDVRVAGDDVILLLPGEDDGEGDGGDDGDGDGDDALVLGPWVEGFGAARGSVPTASSVAAAVDDLRPVVRPSTDAVEATTRRMSPGAPLLLLVVAALLVRYVTAFVF